MTTWEGLFPLDPNLGEAKRLIQILDDLVDKFNKEE